MSYSAQQHEQPGSPAAARAAEDDPPSLHVQEQGMESGHAHLELPGAGLTPLDFIHWLYLQPPADAEVLVQACGRSFVTSWDPIQQHWLTHELPEGVGRVPGLLPRVTHVDVPCLSIQPPNSQRRSQQQPGQSSTTDAQPCHKLLLYGTGLDAPGASFAACLHGNYLHVESRMLPAQLTTQSSGDSNAAAAAVQPCSISSGLGVVLGGSPGTDWNQQGAAPEAGLASASTVGQECVELAVYGITQPGLLQLECWCGRLLTCRKQVAVVTKPAVQLELAYYFGGNVAGAEQSVDGNHMGLDWSGTSFLMDSGPATRIGQAEERKVDDLMTDLGCWVDFVGGMQQLCRCFDTTPAQLQSADTPTTIALLERSQARGMQLDFSQPLLQACLTQAYRQQMVDTAVQLLAHACSCAWAETADSLLKELMTFGLTFKDVKHKAQSASSSSLLHRAVCSKSPRMIRLVWDWGVTYGPEWTWAEADPGNGITPLHMAAALDAQLPANFLSAHQRLLNTHSTGRLSSVGSTLADWILQEYQAAYQYWHGAEDCRGMTPADVAELHSMQATPSSSTDHLPISGSPSSPTLAGLHGAPGAGIVPFGSNLESACGSTTADDRAGNAGTSMTDASRRPTSDLTSASPALAVAAGDAGQSRLVRSALEPADDGDDDGDELCLARKATAPATSASISSWVVLQQQLAASQQQPLGPPDLTPASNEKLTPAATETQTGSIPSSSSKANAAQAANQQQPLQHGQQAAQQSALPPPTIPDAAPGNSTTAGSERISDYQALVSAIQSGRYRNESSHQSGRGGQGHSSRQQDAQLTTAASAAALTSSSSGRTLNVGGVGGGGGRLSDAQRLAELQTTRQLLQASLSEFSSRRLEQGYLGWLQNRRQRVRELLPKYMLGLVLLVLTSEVWHSVTSWQSGPASSLCRFFSVLLYALPWMWMQWQGNGRQQQQLQQQQQRHKAHSPSRRAASQNNSRGRANRLQDEQVWLLIMLWYLFFRSLQAAGVLALTASTPLFLRAGGDCLTEGFVQVLFQVRTRHVALVRLLYVLSSTALYMRVHVFPNPMHALLVAGFGNLVCLLAAWALDVSNRRTYIQLLQVQLQSSSLEKQSGPRVGPLRPRGEGPSAGHGTDSQRRASGHNNSRASGSSRLRPRLESAGMSKGASSSKQAAQASASSRPQGSKRAGGWLHLPGPPRDGGSDGKSYPPDRGREVLLMSDAVSSEATVQGSTVQGASVTAAQHQLPQHQQSSVAQVAISRGAVTPQGGHVSQARRRAGALAGALIR